MLEYCQTQLVLDQVANTAKARGISEEEVIKKAMLEPHATDKFIKISKLAALVEFLCSSKYASVTGAALPMDWMVDGQLINFKTRLSRIKFLYLSCY